MRNRGDEVVVVGGRRDGGKPEEGGHNVAPFARFSFLFSTSH